MFSNAPKLELTGKVRPPQDMVEAAKKTLGPRYADFVKKFPGEVTPAKLCKYLES